MIRVEAIWLALGASDLRAGIDVLLAQVVKGFALGAQEHKQGVDVFDALVRTFKGAPPQPAFG